MWSEEFLDPRDGKTHSIGETVEQTCDESAEEFRTLVTGLFNRLTDRVSFAVSWIEKFLAPYLQKLSE